ncbi:putative plant snare 11, partial [Quercus suber]
IVKKEKGWFVRWVNGVLRLHQGSTIDELRACSVVSDKNFTLDIENWLSFLLRKKVKRFALECKGLRNCDYQQYTLTDQFLCNYGLDSLTVLCLTYVQVTEKALLYVLSNCPFLEVLSVECLDSLQNLKPSGPLVGLRNVAISTSYYAHVARILLGNVPNLVEASYAGLYAFFLLRERDQMPSYLSLLETLSLVLTWQTVQDIINVGTATAAALKAQTEQMSRVVNELDYIHFSIKKASQLVMELGGQTVQDTTNVGTETAALKAQTEQMNQVVNELDSIPFSIKKASQLVKELGTQVATDRCIMALLFLIVIGVIAIIIVKLVNPNNKDIRDIPGLAPRAMTQELLWSASKKFLKGSSNGL